MFESLESRVAGYGTDDILKAAEAAVRARLVAEIELMAWTTAWADVNSAESIHPDELRLLGGARPGSSFPWSTATGRLEFDHSEPHRSMDEGGPPGQTSTDALIPLAKREPRAVTHGGWRRQPEPGTMIFRSPHGDCQVTN